MHICTIEVPQASWYHINICISNTKSKPENIHYPLQPYQKSPPMHNYTCKSMSLRSPINAQTEVKADEKIDIHGFFPTKKTTFQNPGIGIEWNWHHVDILKKATSASAKDFFNTFLPASYSRPSEPFRALISKHLSTYNCENMFPGMWCPENPIPKTTSPPPQKKKRIACVIDGFTTSQFHSRKLLQSHKHPFAAPKNARTTANQFLSESFQASSWAFFVCFYSVQSGPIVIISRIITQVTHL